MESLGKPIGGAAVVGHTVPMDGFDQGEHGAGTGVSGGHVPSATNQQKGYGQDSSFNAGLGGEHASGGLPKHNSTPIADKFMGSSSHGTSSSDAVSGAYEGGSARDALTGESNAHTTGKGVGVLGENLHGSHSTSTHGASTHGASSGAYDGSINRSAATGESHSHSARDAALTGTAGAASAAALGSTVSHGQGSGTGVGPSGGSGGHYSQGQTGHSGVTTGHSSSGENYNVGTGTGAGLLAGQQAGARGTHGTSGLAAGAGAAGVGAGAASSGIHSGDKIDDNNTRGEPLSNPKDLDSGTRHGLVFDKTTGKYVHRHELDEKK